MKIMVLDFDINSINVTKKMSPSCLQLVPPAPQVLQPLLALLLRQQLVRLHRLLVLLRLVRLGRLRLVTVRLILELLDRLLVQRARHLLRPVLRV